MSCAGGLWDRIRGRPLKLSFLQSRLHHAISKNSDEDFDFTVGFICILR